LAVIQVDARVNAHTTRLLLGYGVTTRFGPRPIVPAGCLFAVASLVLLTRIDQDSDYATGVLPSVLLFGFGVGLLFGCAQNVATAGVGPDDSGVASALVNTMQQVGGSLGLALFTSLSATAVNRYLASNPGQPGEQLQTLAALTSYHTVFWVAAAVFLLGAVATGALFRSGPVAASRT
jgi:hypothetical protein